MDDEEIKELPLNRYERGSKNIMKEPLPAPWGLPIGDADIENNNFGFRSCIMDEKGDKALAK